MKIKQFGMPAEKSKLMLTEKFIDFIKSTTIPNGCPVQYMTINIKIPGAMITQKIEICNEI